MGGASCGLGLLALCRHPRNALSPTGTSESGVDESDASCDQESQHPPSARHQPLCQTSEIGWLPVGTTVDASYASTGEATPAGKQGRP